jgi:cyanophycinase
MIPKGKLLIIGGAEDKGEEAPDMEAQNKQFEHFEILNKLFSENNRSQKIEVITTASKIPDEMQKKYIKAFKKIGYHQVGFIDIANKEEVRNKEYEDRISEAGSILFSGGDQFRISSIIGGSRLCDIIVEKYLHDEHFIVAGTSAGAMAIPSIMIWDGGTEEALIDKDIKTAAGLGLLRHCIVDTHFIKRGRFGRLAHAVIINPAELGIGLGEDTALLISKGTEATCLGSGMVVIIDAKEVGQTNITEAEEGCPIYVENLKVHLIVKGCRFSLEERKLYNPVMSRTKKNKVT